MRTKTILLAAVTVAAFVALAAACGDDDSTKTTPAAGGDNSGGTANSTAATGTKQPQQSPTAAASAGKLSDLLKDSSKLTYYVVYSFESAGANAIKGTYTLAQKPPKSLSSFDMAGQGTFSTINDGQQTYSCTKLGAQPTGVCQKSAAGGSAGAGLSFFNLAAIAQTASVVPDSKEIDGRKVAGRDARCFQYSPSGGSPSTVCVDKENGLMVYVETNDSSGKMTITATDIKGSVDDKVFDLPYKVQ